MSNISAQYLFICIQSDLYLLVMMFIQTSFTLCLFGVEQLKHEFMHVLLPKVWIKKVDICNSLFSLPVQNSIYIIEPDILQVVTMNS